VSDNADNTQETDVNPSSVRRAAIPAIAALALGLGLSGCGAANEQSGNGGGGATGQPANAAGNLSGTLNGAGSTAQQAAQDGWTAKFQGANPNVTINYDPVGSGGGVDQFLAGGVQFAGSDAYLTTDQVSQSKKACGGQTAIEVPDYISPIALVYNVKGVSNLRLTPDTVAKIFAGKITQWNDPAIKATNPGVNLPSERITPVHRSDDSGTTENFTDYLHQAASRSWTYPAAETWPIKSGEGADGTSGVIAAVSKGAGTIGYADASKAGDLGVAQIKVGDGFQKPTAEAAAAIVDASERVTGDGRSANDWSIELNRTADGDVYPIVLLSYAIACQKYKDAATANLVKSYLSYVASEAGQQDAVKTAKMAPLSSKLSADVEAAAATIS